MTKIFISPHNKIGYFFLVLTVIFFLSLIFGFFESFYGAQIIITPKMEEIDVNFLAGFKENPSQEDLVLNGQLLETKQTLEKKYYPEATVSMEDYAEGEIFVKNNTWSSVSFIASTRFASPNGLIFRAVNRIKIPAKEEISVLVRADKMGADYEIEPSQFTIPNLKDPDLKENIVAESRQLMTGGLKKTGVIMESDIIQAKKEIEEKLYQNGLDEIENKIIENDVKLAIKSEIIKETIDAKAGEEKSEFNINGEIEIKAVAFQEKDLLNIALVRLEDSVQLGKKLVAYEPKNLSYFLKEYNQEEQSAVLEVQFRGYTVISEENEILDKNKLKGLNKEEAQNYLKGFNEIDEAKIKFYPPYFLKKIPQSLNKIKIKINR